MIAMNFVYEVLLGWAIGGLFLLFCVPSSALEPCGRRLLWLLVLAVGPVMWLLALWIFICAFFGRLFSNSHRGLPSPKTIDQRGRGE